MDRVSIIGAKQYDVGMLIPVIKAHFGFFGGIDRIIKEGMKVVIKPNLLMRKNPDAACTTHPAFIEAIVRVVMEAGASVVIADSPGGPNNLTYLKLVYNATGMTRIAARTGCELNYDLSSSEVKVPQGLICRKFRVLNCINDADIVISVAKLKTHGLNYFTGAVKNIFGAVPGLTKAEFHMRFQDKNDFSNMLIDLCVGINPAISFMDGIIGMEGNGPSGGNPRFLGCTLASVSPFTLDFVASYLIGYKPNEVPMIQNSINRGLCPDSIEKYNIMDDILNKFRVSNFKKPDSFRKEIKTRSKMPQFINDYLKSQFTPRPVINKKKCTGCGECTINCPARVITMAEDNKAVIDYKGCINCFCCQELCTFKAIDIKRKKFFDF